MREAIGGTWLFGLVLTFIVFFASFLALSINYAKAFNVKNSIVDLVSKYEGNNCKARKSIKDYLVSTGYLVSGVCLNGYQGYDMEGNEVDPGKKAYYCILNGDTGDNTVLNKNYYRIMIFFHIDLPIVGDLTTFRIKGETESIYFSKDEISSKCSGV